jgi:hypothetical protein
MIGSALANRSTVAKQKQSGQVFRYPVPIGGLDARRTIGSQDLNNCIYTYNLVPYEYGMAVRHGYREWQVGYNLGFGLGIRTLIPYDSALESEVGDSLFAVTNEGIWNPAEYDTPPTLAVAFPIIDGNAGFGTYAHYVTDAAENIVFYADAENGLYVFENDVWAPSVDISSDDPANPLEGVDIKFVVVHKERIWFVKRNSTTAFYLAIGAKQGNATPFFFGSKLKHGGTLEGLFNWSVDGGDGADDQLVGVGHAGDVIIYKGLDPEDASWTIVGTYFIGQIPNTPKFGTQQGGELHLLSTFGLVSMNDILKGVDSNIMQSDADGTGMAVKIASIIREYMQTDVESNEWSIAFAPSEGGLILDVPQRNSNAHIQLYYNIAARAWGFWRNVPMHCFETWRESVFFGTADGRLCRMDVPVDNKVLDPIDPVTNGDDIEFSILTSYSALGAEGVYKRPKLIRPDFVSTLPPSHSSLCRFDYDTEEATNFDETFVPRNFVGIWDASNWDFAIWASRDGTTFPTIGGVWGYGRYVAIATFGACRSTTRLVGWDLVYDVGGPMI